MQRSPDSFQICTWSKWLILMPTKFKLEKALGELRYLRQSKVIRQVASPSSVCQRFPYAPFNAMVTKISKWSRIQDSCRITPKIESLVVCAMLDIPSKFQKDPSITFWVILLTDRQTDRQTKTGKKHNLLGERKNVKKLWKRKMNMKVHVELTEKGESRLRLPRLLVLSDPALLPPPP